MLYYILVPLAWVLAHIVFRPQVIGRENLIKGRGFILAPNHRSALDPVFIVLSDGYFWLHKMRIRAVSGQAAAGMVFAPDGRCFGKEWPG